MLYMSVCSDVIINPSTFAFAQTVCTASALTAQENKDRR